MDAITTYHLFRSYDVERGTANARNLPGYAQATAAGGTTIAMTRYEWRETARIDGAKLKFHRSEYDAKQAAKDSRK